MELQILGPVDSLVPAGQTVQFLCRAVTTARTLLTLQVCSVSSYAEGLLLVESALRVDLHFKL